MAATIAEPLAIGESRRTPREAPPLFAFAQVPRPGLERNRDRAPLVTRGGLELRELHPDPSKGLFARGADQSPVTTGLRDNKGRAMAVENAVRKFSSIAKAGAAETQYDRRLSRQGRMCILLALRAQHHPAADGGAWCEALAGWNVRGVEYLVVGAADAG